MSLPTDAYRRSSKHLDLHLKPYRCNFRECVGTQFSSTGCLLRHEREIHKLHRQGAKAHFVHSHDGVEPFEDITTPSFPKRNFHGDPITHKMQSFSKHPHVCSLQDCDNSTHKKLGDEDGIFEHEKETHVPYIYGTSPSMESNDYVGRDTFEFFDSHRRPTPNLKLEPRYLPKLDIDSTSLKCEQPKEAFKEHKEKILVDVDFLHKLESKISDLQSRVEVCEGAPDSPSASSVSGSEDSVDSVSDLGYKGGRATRFSEDFDDEIIICESGTKKEKQGTKDVEGPILEIARWNNHFGENQRFEAVREGMSTPAVQFAAGRPLLTIVSEYDHNLFWRRRIEIASPAFFDLLNEVSQHNIVDLVIHEGVLYLMEPLMILFLNRKQLTDYVQNTKESTQAKEHADFVLNFLKSDFSDTSRLLDNFESVTPPNLVKYSDLWMLYRPGTTVYSRANGEWEAFVIDGLDGMQVRKPSPDNRHALTRLDMRAWSMNFDGEVYGRVWSIHCVAPFHGVKDISSLPLVPEKFLVDGNAIRESLISRGKKFCTFQVQHYQESEIIPSQSTRVMIDHLTYQKRNGWLISIDGKYGPTSAKHKSWRDNRFSDWDTSGEAFDRRPRRYTPQRSLVRHFEDEYCSRDYELESIDKAEDTQAEPCRSYSIDRPSHVVVRDFEKYDLIQPDAKMDDLTLVLCPQHVRGFCFQDKVWSKCFNRPVPCKI